MYEHNASGYWSGLALCLTKVRSSRARCPATALIAYAKSCISHDAAHMLTYLMCLNSCKNDKFQIKKNLLYTYVNISFNK